MGIEPERFWQIDYRTLRLYVSAYELEQEHRAQERRDLAWRTAHLTRMEVAAKHGGKPFPRHDAYVQGRDSAVLQAEEYARELENFEAMKASLLREVGQGNGSG